MSAELPLWYGRERGTDLAAFIELDIEAPDAGSGERAFAVLGLLSPALTVAPIIAISQPPIIVTVLVGLVFAAWLALGSWAVLLVGGEEEPPPWAEGMVTALVWLGRVTVWPIVILSGAIVLIIVIGLIGAFVAASDRR